MKPNHQTETLPESDIIRADIEHTRESMDHTLDELGEKMKPRHLFDEMLGFLHLKQLDGEKLKRQAGAAVQSAGEAAGRAAHAITGVVREHPIPTILIGAGIAYAIYESTHRTHEGNGKRVSYEDEDDLANEEGQDQLSWNEGEAENWEPGGLKEKAADTLESAKQGIQSAKEKVKDKVNVAGRKIRQRASEGAKAIGQKATEIKDQVAHSAQRGYEVGRAKFVETTQAHPLTLGLGFLAAGVLVGLALPPSRKEDEWVGEAADRIKDRARAKGEDLVKRGKSVASAAADAVKKSAAEEGLTPQALKDKVKRVASETEQAAQRSAEQQGLKPAPFQPSSPPAGSGGPIPIPTQAPLSPAPMPAGNRQC